MGFTSHIFIYDSTYHALDLGVPGRRTRVGRLPPPMETLEPSSSPVLELRTPLR
jgi:hypothetical protein